MENKSESLKSETLDFIFEYTRQAPEIQLKDVEALDGKVIQILSVSSVIIGLVGFAIGKNEIKFPYLTPFLVALLAYVALAVTAFIHLQAREYRRSIQADVLWDTFWKDDIKDIKHSLVTDISKAYAHNKTLIRKKGRTLLFVVVFAAIEVIAVGGFIILSAMSTSP